MDSQKLLDKGYIRLIETWGSDERIVESARMSTQKGFEGWGTAQEPGDEKLLRFLYENKHTTPFEMAGATIEVKAPIMVFREWHRHRTMSYNEASARYGKLPDESYVPDVRDVMARALAAIQTKNKQAQGVVTVPPTEEQVSQWLADLNRAYNICEEVYLKGLEIGIPKELARLPVTVGRYSKMRASANLLNLIKFIGLRSAPNAQKEIRVYSNALYGILKSSFPRTFQFVGENYGDFNLQELT